MRYLECACECACACACAYACTCAFPCECVDVFACACACAYACACTRACMRLCVIVYGYMSVCLSVRVCVCVRKVSQAGGLAIAASRPSSPASGGLARPRAALAPPAGLCPYFVEKVPLAKFIPCKMSRGRFGDMASATGQVWPEAIGKRNYVLVFGCRLPAAAKQPN